MLHLQLVANIANSFGYSPVLTPGAFVYAGVDVPHLDFSLDPDNPIPQFTPYSAEIGPLDQPRINAMCLIEYPEWETGGKPDYQQDVRDYGSIGEFYDALEYGAHQLADHIAGGVNQVDLFSAFYRDLPTMTVQTSGREGWPEVQLLIDVIRDQGEAAKVADAIATPNRNTADDPAAEQSHYEKFTQIRGAVLPAVYPVKDPGRYAADDTKRQAILVADFSRFTGAVSQLCAGRRPRDFETLMVTLGGDILACWKGGAVPQFTRPGQPRVGAFA
jgi:hypothetical protein